MSWKCERTGADVGVYSKIDPVRRVRRYAVDESHTKSYFRDALESWTDLNLSTTFVEFARRALPLSDSLPLILHHQTSIFDALLEFIGKRDTLSLEPLLDLLAHFAHDLGASFEPYFGRAVLLLSDLVARHVDVSTVEWTFGCLAYLLKYLSRLLVPDLRPLYDILAPLLGRTPQKPFNTRFAAEALSFLVRKTKSESLELIVKHGFTDLRQAGENPGYAEGLMTMFCEACTVGCCGTGCLVSVLTPGTGCRQELALEGTASFCLAGLRGCWAGRLRWAVLPGDAGRADIPDTPHECRDLSAHHRRDLRKCQKPGRRNKYCTR